MKTLLHTIVFVLFISFSHAGSAFNEAFELNQEGEAYALKGNLNQAIYSYETAVSMFPSYGTAYINLIKTYYQLEDFQRVIEMAENALKIVPNSADLHFFLGTAYIEWGDENKGIAAINKAIAINPNYQIVSDETNSESKEVGITVLKDIEKETLLMSKK